MKQAISTIGIVRTAGAGSLSRSTEGTYFQTVNFETEKGKTITITSTMGSSGDRGSEGAAVEVLYLISSPESAVIKDFKNIWGFESIVFIVGFTGLIAHFYEI